MARIARNGRSWATEELYRIAGAWGGVRCGLPSLQSAARRSDGAAGLPPFLAQTGVERTALDDAPPRRIECAPLERYRSGHNGTDSKSVEGITSLRGFESLPLRQFPQAQNADAFWAFDYRVKVFRSSVFGKRVWISGRYLPLANG